MWLNQRGKITSQIFKSHRVNLVSFHTHVILFLGTEKQHVVDDYSKSLYKGREGCKGIDHKA